MTPAVSVHNRNVLSACFHDCCTWLLSVMCRKILSRICGASWYSPPLSPPTEYFSQLLVNVCHVWQNECLDLCKSMTHTEISTTPFPVMWRHEGSVKVAWLICPVQELTRAQLEVMCTWNGPDHWPVCGAVFCWHRWQLNNGADSSIFLLKHFSLQIDQWINIFNFGDMDISLDSL
jgi:hypothetical protein